MNCEDCKHFYVRKFRAYCMKRGDVLIPDGYSCPEFEAKFKPPKFCKDCKHCRPNHGYCNKMIPQGCLEQLNCPEFESAYQITTTRNPYIKNFTVDDPCKPDVPFTVKWHGDNMDALLYGKWNTERKEYNKMFKMDKVKKVIFNPPATIVYWFDGTKTIVKVQDGEIFDKEKGFAMACAKKFFGNKGNYYKEFRKHGADVSYIDLAHPGEVVKSSIGDGISYDGAGSVSMSPNKIREMVGFPPVISHPTDAIGKVVKSSIDDGLSFTVEGVNKDLITKLCDFVEPVKEETKAERIQKKKEYIDDIALKAAVDCRLNVEVVESNDGDVEYVFSFMHDDNKYKRKHCIGHDEFDVYSQEYLGNRLECRIGVWLGELAKAGVEPVKKESE